MTVAMTMTRRGYRTCAKSWYKAELDISRARVRQSGGTKTMVQLSTATALSLFLLSCQNHVHIRPVQSFSFVILGVPRHSRILHLRPLNSEVEISSGCLEGSLSGSILHEYTLTNHKPLGCSVEESLAKDDINDKAKYVFVSEVNKGSNADKVGIRVGDVIVQLSGTFDEVVDVSGLGIERVRSLVGGRSEDRPLVIRVARGSDIKERHELALVELCIIGDDAEIADCITSIYSGDYNDVDMNNNEMTVCDEDDGSECMIDSIWKTWTEGMPESDEREDADVIEEEKIEKKKIDPWSRRSSPSGTYVRDPTTGQMVNIDE